ncbi:MBL fold metallo-hydrolase [Roseospira visakhapatnamensis]|uniref:Phosphoribosyl 1,2-cyclic phosphodiesterase n=1 Tax=Roseospira visakhapatnamensis TaxID=390880 RepID=A0A7W6RFL1_9PROT|nr:MBL fold metallo-hydrolase [Roseospira visakhapatnamensis]MBB4267013.1 phosphoribosyl 1,2-cyclic phosphodiesterase [Roseospira visakhapatnamensis]
MSCWVKFWGVRGSIPCPSPDHVIYGGNTSCVEVHLDGRHVVFDAGTGLRLLGRSFLDRGVSAATLLMTHTHWDHIIGFPFFAPAYRPDFSLTVMAGHVADNGGIRALFSTHMSDPMFPVPLEAMNARMAFRDFKPRDGFALDPAVRVTTTPLNHPNGATGYRLDYAGLSICYVTDTEHVPGAPDENVLSLIAEADLVIYDSTYTDEEFPAKLGWGHSTWCEGMRLCRAARARRLVVFHHDPDHDDAFMGCLEDEIRRACPEALVARDGMGVTLRP